MRRLFKWRHKPTIIFVIIVALLCTVRLALPFILQSSINWFLQNKMDAYEGHIDSLNLSLYRGAYQINELKIWKKDAHQVPFIHIPKLDVSIAWRALWHQYISADIVIQHPEINLVDSKDQNKKQLGKEKAPWNQVLKKLIPMDIESLIFKEGSVHFYNAEAQIPIHLYMHNFFADIKNINNMESSKEVLPSTMKVTASLQDSGYFVLNGAFNILRQKPNFDFDFQLKDFSITQLNPFFLHYGPFSVSGGNFELYSELAAQDGLLKGYVKPVASFVKVMHRGENFKTLKHWAIELLVSMANGILRNSENKSVVTRITVGGDVEHPQFSTDHSLRYSLKNSFGEPAPHQLEHSVRFHPTDRLKSPQAR